MNRVAVAYEWVRSRAGEAAPCVPVTIRDVIRLLQADVWQVVRTKGSHRQFKHPWKPGVVTVAGKPGLDLPPGTMRSILKQAGLMKRSP